MPISNRTFKFDIVTSCLFCVFCGWIPVFALVQARPPAQPALAAPGTGSVGNGGSVLATVNWNKWSGACGSSCLSRWSEFPHFQSPSSSAALQQKCRGNVINQDSGSFEQKQFPMVEKKKSEAYKNQCTPIKIDTSNCLIHAGSVIVRILLVMACQLNANYNFQADCLIPRIVC